MLLPAILEPKPAILEPKMGPLVLIGKGLLLEGETTTKIEDKQVPGLYSWLGPAKVSCRLRLLFSYLLDLLLFPLLQL